MSKKPHKMRVIKAWALKSSSGKFVWVGSQLIVGRTKQAATIGLPWKPYVVRVEVRELA